MLKKILWRLTYRLCNRFWGVFYVDASSDKRIAQTYSDLSRYGDFDSNKEAAMHWLSNLAEPWLLIIDNADTSQSLDHVFPKGDRGCVLITTRNPAHRVHGNVGPGSFELQGMEDTDANTLLLRAAHQPRPWNVESALCAAHIAKHLGWLALALEHAGAAIRNGLCTLKNYLDYYNKSWERIRREPISGTTLRQVPEDYKAAYTSYEVAYEGLADRKTQASSDAIQLLKIFAFFYFKNIQLETIRRAIVNAKTESVQDALARKSESERSQTFWDKLVILRISVHSWLWKNRGPSVLPAIILEGRETNTFDEWRLRLALKELIQLSLITDNKNDTYSMHPLVHKWVRERPEMLAIEQAVCVHAAALILAHSILLPSAGKSETNEAYCRSILPHVDHVRSCQHAIQARIALRRRQRWYGLSQWPRADSDMDRETAIMYAKYSTVYAQGGRFRETEELQAQVKRYADQLFGLDFAITRRITLALSATYWQQSRGDEAAELQNAVLQACTRSLGLNALETLQTMVVLGKTRWMQGQYTASKSLLMPAVEGLVQIAGPGSEDALDARDNLGKTLGVLFDFEAAEDSCTQAIEGLTEILGPEHERTLIARENLATLSQHSGKGLREPLQTMEEILRIRRDKLGKEHTYTLLAMVNLGRLKGLNNQHEEAERLILTGLEIADRNLGKDHIGSMMGRTALGEIYNRSGNYDKAEKTLISVIERQSLISKSRGRLHPDRIWSLMELGK